MLMHQQDRIGIWWRAETSRVLPQFHGTQARRTVLFNCEHQLANPFVMLPRHGTSTNQDDRRGVMGTGYIGNRHRSSGDLAVTDRHCGSRCTTASRAAPVVERPGSNDDRGHRRSPPQPLKRATLASASLTAALSGLSASDPSSLASPAFRPEHSARACYRIHSHPSRCRSSS